MSYSLNPRLYSDERLADMSQEALHWPESNFNDLKNEEVYHSTSEFKALSILDDMAFNPMEDDFIDNLRVYALRDVEAVEEGKIELSEYLVEKQEELSQQGPKKVEQGLNKKNAEEWGDLLEAYGFSNMDVRTPTSGARRTESLHVGSDRELTKTQSSLASDVTFELIVPENCRHNSDIPGEVPFSYTTAIYINDAAENPEELAQEIEERLEGSVYEHVEVERDF